MFLLTHSDRILMLRSESEGIDGSGEGSGVGEGLSGVVVAISIGVGVGVGLGLGVFGSVGGSDGSISGDHVLREDSLGGANFGADSNTKLSGVTLVAVLHPSDPTPDGES